MCVCVYVVGACGTGRGGKKAHSVEGFTQITSASGGERGMLHNVSFLYYLHLTYYLQLYYASMLTKHVHSYCCQMTFCLHDLQRLP